RIQRRVVQGVSDLPAVAIDLDDEIVPAEQGHPRAGHCPSRGGRVGLPARHKETWQTRTARDGIGTVLPCHRQPVRIEVRQVFKIEFGRIDPRIDAIGHQEPLHIDVALTLWVVEPELCGERPLKRLALDSADERVHRALGSPRRDSLDLKESARLGGYVRYEPRTVSRLPRRSIGTDWTEGAPQPRPIAASVSHVPALGETRIRPLRAGVLEI